MKQKFLNLKITFESLIYFSHRFSQHIQDEALCNEKVLEGTFYWFVCPIDWEISL